MNKEESKIEFIFSALMSVVSLIAFLFLITENNIARSGIIFILPCFSDSLRTITIDKENVSRLLFEVNLIIFIIASLCIVLCVSVVLGIINMNILIKFLFLSYFIRNISHSLYFLANY